MVFEITYDPISNIKFVKCVEKYPSVYNQMNISRLDKDKAKIAWEKIAAELNSTAYFCKNRWTKLKNCYNRYLRLEEENKTIKPYYLANYMEFVKPYISVKLRNKKRQKAVAVHSDEDITIADIQMTNDNITMEECNDFPGNPIFMVFDSSEDEEVAFNTGSSALEGSTSSRHGYSGKKSEETSSNERENLDLCFYKSLLPEIDLMTPEQNLRWRKELLNAINITLYGEDLNNDFVIKNEGEN